MHCFDSKNVDVQYINHHTPTIYFYDKNDKMTLQQELDNWDSWGMFDLFDRYQLKVVFSIDPFLGQQIILLFLKVEPQ